MGEVGCLSNRVAEVMSGMAQQERVRTEEGKVIAKARKGID